MRTWGQWFLERQPVLIGNASRLIGLGGSTLTVGPMGRGRWKALTWERPTLRVRERPEAGPPIRQRSKAAARTIRSKVAKATFLTVIE